MKTDYFILPRFYILEFSCRSAGCRERQLCYLWHYEPLLGEFPKIRGDQSVFFIFNDENDARDEDVKNYLGVEFQGMAYAYNDSTNNALMNTVFLHYDIINRSDIDYYDTYIGNFNPDFVTIFLDAF